MRQIIADEVIGGIGVLLFGDFAQLPPVADSPLYSSKIPLKPLQIAGRDVYLSFNQSTTLQHIFCQQGNDPISQHFHDAIHLFPTQADVEDCNHHYLESAHIPVLRCKARHSGGRHAKLATENQADGLEAELLLAVGAKVMLTQNIWTDRGIYFFLCH